MDQLILSMVQWFNVSMVVMGKTLQSWRYFSFRISFHFQLSLARSKKWLLMVQTKFDYAYAFAFFVSWLSRQRKCSEYSVVEVITIPVLLSTLLFLLLPFVM